MGRTGGSGYSHPCNTYKHAGPEEADDDAGRWANVDSLEDRERIDEVPEDAIGFGIPFGDQMYSLVPFEE